MQADFLGKRYLISTLAMLLAVGVATLSFVERGSANHSPEKTSIVFKSTGHPSRSELSATAKELTNRLRTLGVDGAATVLGTNEIYLSIPRLENPTQIVSEIGQTDQLYFRPTLCYAPPYQKPAASTGTNPATAPPQELPTDCTPRYRLDTSNLTGSAGSGTGVRYTTSATPALAAYPSSTVDTPKATVLLPGLHSSSGRYLLGPAELTGNAVKKAVAQHTTLGRWVVNMSLTTSGTTGWNAMAKKYFHEVIGIELDGVVQTAPLTLPTATDFTTFSGDVQISGNFSKSQAEHLAMAVNWSALSVQLEEVSVRTVGR